MIPTCHFTVFLWSPPGRLESIVPRVDKSSIKKADQNQRINHQQSANGPHERDTQKICSWLSRWLIYSLSGGEVNPPCCPLVAASKISDTVHSKKYGGFKLLKQKQIRVTQNTHCDVYFSLCMHPLS